jgi:hypothetical protein
MAGQNMPIRLVTQAHKTRNIVAARKSAHWPSAEVISEKRCAMFLQSYEFGCDGRTSHQSLGSLNVTVNSPRHAAALLG